MADPDEDQTDADHQIDYDEGDLNEDLTELDDASAEDSAAVRSPLLDLPPPPAADFSQIVEMFASQSLAAMGRLPGADGEPRLDYAKYFIELLDVLEAKTKSDRTAEDSEMLQQTLHYLRMMYVQARKG